MNHQFQCRLVWTGEAGGPVRSYDAYSREMEVSVFGKPPLKLSAAGVFRGDEKLHNPEDLLVASLAACHFLSYAALCARQGVVIIAYADDASGTMAFDPARKVTAFTEVVLRPRTTIASASDVELARRLHERAHHECFIANSVNFPVRNEPEIVTR